MFLDDFNKTPRSLSKINKLLAEQYGISISRNMSARKLRETDEKLREYVDVLKLNGNMSHRCPEISRSLLILEGIDILLKDRRLYEMFSDSNDYIRIVSLLSDFVIRNVEVGDELDDAMAQAMKEYRSSKWRWPDEYVSYDVETQVEQRMLPNVPFNGADVPVEDLVI